MSDSITFYTNPMSRGRIVHWMLEEVGMPYDMKIIDFKKNEHKSPAFLKINPMGKIPTIVHRDTVVTESAAICTYLADAFPAAKLAPALSDPQRATYLRWMFFTNGCLEPAMIDKLFPRAEAPQASALGYGTYDDTLNAVEKALTPGPFILGERFSAVDVQLGSTIGWGFMMKNIEPRPVFQRYVERCSQRPAYQRFMQQCEALLPKKA